MSHITSPAPTWRKATLRIAELNEFGIACGEPWLTSAGQFADDNAEAVSTCHVRAVALGHETSRAIGGGASPMFLVTLASRGGPVADGAAPMSLADASYATAPERTAPVPRSVLASAVPELEVALRAAEVERDLAEGWRDNAIAHLGEREAEYRAAEAEVLRLAALTGAMQSALDGVEG